MATFDMRMPDGWELQFATNHLGHFAPPPDCTSRSRRPAEPAVLAAGGHCRRRDCALTCDDRETLSSARKRKVAYLTAPDPAVYLAFGEPRLGMAVISSGTVPAGDPVPVPSTAPGWMVSARAETTGRCPNNPLVVCGMSNGC